MSKKSTTRGSAGFIPEDTSSEIMTTPEITGDSQLQTVLSALLEDRRAMQANIDALMRTVEE